MSDLLDIFETERIKIQHAFDALLKLSPQELTLGNPDKTFKAKDIEDWKRSLSESRFTVCVAGQMNAGKSSTINALLFDRAILPVYDTVMTSTITLIEHSNKRVGKQKDKEGVKIVFYTQAEWTKITETNRTPPEKKGDDEEDNKNQKIFELAKKSFEAQINDARNAGIQASTYIGHAALELEGFTRLDEYIAPIGNHKKGKYTPFVKEVTLFVTHPMLENLCIVDTPGINDPNPVRDQKTKEYIKRADAVLYITYAGQAFAAEDINFVKNYMYHVNAEYRVVAMNKIDTLSNQHELTAYVESLKTSKDPAIQDLVTNTPCVPVCAYGALLEKAIAAKKPLDEDDLFYKEEFEKKGFLEPENHGLPELKAAIATRLMENIGKQILESSRNKARGFFAQTFNALNIELENVEEKQKNMTRSQESLGAKIKMLQDKSNEIISLTNTFADEAENIATGAAKEIRDLIEKSKEETEAQLERELEKLTTLGQLQDGQYSVKKVFEGQLSAIHSEITAIFKQVDVSSAHRYAKLERGLKSLDVMSDRRIEFAMQKAAIGLEVDPDSVIRNISMSITDIIEDKLNWWQRNIYTPDEKLPDIRHKIKITAMPSFCSAVDSVNKAESRTLLFNNAKTLSARVEEATRSAVEDTENSLISSQNDTRSLAVKKEEILKTMAIVKQQIEKMQSLKEALNNDITSL